MNDISFCDFISAVQPNQQVQVKVIQQSSEIQKQNTVELLDNTISRMKGRGFSAIA